jgi:general secretion pathway protein G
MKQKISGFTLVELLVAIGIIVILIGISAVAFRGSQAGARDTQRKAELEQIRSALELYRSDSSGGDGSYVTGSGEADAVLSSDLEPDFIDSIPVDPRDYEYEYVYESSDGITYKLCAYLENENPGATCSNDCGDEACNYEVNNP